MGNSYTAVHADINALKRLYGSRDETVIPRLDALEPDSYARQLLRKAPRMLVVSDILAGEDLSPYPLHEVKYTLIALTHAFGTPVGELSTWELKYFDELSARFPGVPIDDGLFCEGALYDQQSWFAPINDDGDGPWYGLVSREECAELEQALSGIRSALPASDTVREHEIHTAISAIEETHVWCKGATDAGEDLLLFLY